MKAMKQRKTRTAALAAVLTAALLLCACGGLRPAETGAEQSPSQGQEVLTTAAAESGKETAGTEGSGESAGEESGQATEAASESAAPTEQQTAAPTEKQTGAPTEKQTSAPTKQETAAPTEPETQAPADPNALHVGMTLRELGLERGQQAVVETALAWYYKNPYVQYQYLNPITAMTRAGAYFDTTRLQPESFAADTPYYGHCRSMGGDIFYAALGLTIGSSRVPWGYAGAHKNMIVLQYGGTATADNVKYFDNQPAFCKKLREILEPGDIVDVYHGKSDFHVMIYLGDCLGDGKDYLVHCWPYQGGSVYCWPSGQANHSGSTTENFQVKNPLEAKGACMLQTYEDLLLGKGSPSWPIQTGNVSAIYVTRPMIDEKVLDTVLPAPSVTRLQYPGLEITKDVGHYASETLLQGEELTVSLKLTNHSRQDHGTLTVTEPIPAGTALAGGISEGGQAAGSQVSWNVALAAGQSVTLSFKLRVTAAPGSTVSFAAGSVGHIATKSTTLKVGAGALTAAQKQNLSVLSKGKLPEGLRTNTQFLDLSVFSRIYKEALGMEIDLPATATELLDALFTRKMVYNNENEPVAMLELRKDADPGLDFMRVVRNTFGYFVYLPDYISNTERALDLSEKFYTPGDCFLVLDTHYKGAGTDPVDTAKAYYYVYLGGGRVLEYHQSSGFKVKYFSDTLARNVMADTFICLRPSQCADPSQAEPVSSENWKKPGEGGKPQETTPAQPPVQPSTEAVVGTPVNLARDAKVSTTYKLVNKSVFPLSMINNGKKDIDGSNLAALVYAPGGSVIFDLGQTATLTGYRIYNYEWARKYGMATAWKVYGSEDGANWFQLDSVELDTTDWGEMVRYVTDVKQGEPDGCDFGGVRARYIKWAVEDCLCGTECSAAHIRLYEFEIWGIR